MPGSPAAVCSLIQSATESSQGQRSSSVSGMPACIFATLAARVQVVALLQVPAQLAGENACHGGLSGSGDAHDDENWLLGMNFGGHCGSSGLSFGRMMVAAS